ncbi:hypothetical protein GN958_ATG04344 [Phytophthora infestans]|uniref:DENR N-terminal domain-containing protein n=1 Tax=Phytophthora infestans TaxID=4787 RepID=A0A8S9V5J5_PHYIN|nr:hypothetical protein GN958_ATG04344 [Phytophthora infestans]
MSPHRERLTRFYKKTRDEVVIGAGEEKYGPKPTDDETFDTAAHSKEETEVAPTPLDSEITTDFDFQRLLAFYQNQEVRPEPGDSAEENDNDDDESEEEEDDGQPKMRHVVYCLIGTVPPEYCEYGTMFNECKPWLAETCPDLMPTKYNRTVVELLSRLLTVWKALPTKWKR